jgi:LacI family transcriptional regulator
MSQTRFRRKARGSRARRRVLTFLPSGTGYAREILRGIALHCQLEGGWQMVPDSRLPGGWGTVQPGDFDGVIGILVDRVKLAHLDKLRCPIVNVSSMGPIIPPTSVVTDNDAIGSMAAEFFLLRGFRHFAFCGMPFHGASTAREASFRARLAKDAFETFTTSAVPVSENRVEWGTYLRRLGAWLADLPKPIGVLAVNDLRGRDLVDACHQLGLRVPDEVAILGVDNDIFLCETSFPMLASVDANLRRIGQAAGELLSSLMRGGKPPKAPLRIPPTGVIARLSADIHAVPDARVADAVRYIREHAGEPLRAADVARHVPVARRSLERRFRQALGRSLEDEIRMARIERAKQLLRQTTLSVEEVAERSGFHYQAHLSTAFKKATGLPPAAWRREHGTAR